MLNISWHYPWYSWMFAHSTVGRHESTHSYGRWRPRSLCHCSYSRRSSRIGSSFLRVHSSLANTLRDGAESDKVNQISWNKGKNKNVLYPTTWINGRNRSAILPFLSETWIREHKTMVSPQEVGPSGTTGKRKAQGWFRQLNKAFQHWGTCSLT